VLSEGDRVAADAIALQCDDLLTDEALLTGESVPVRKLASTRDAVATKSQAGGDDLPFVFSGTLAVRGTGVAEVTATRIRTEIGKIGQSVSTLETETPRLQRQIQRLVTIFAVASAIVVALTVLLYGLYLRQSLVQQFADRSIHAPQPHADPGNDLHRGGAELEPDPAGGGRSVPLRPAPR
jgi:P-type Ca2+ transporter type 2C